MAASSAGNDALPMLNAVSISDWEAAHSNERLSTDMIARVEQALLCRLRAQRGPARTASRRISFRVRLESSLSPLPLVNECVAGPAHRRSHAGPTRRPRPPSPLPVLPDHGDDPKRSDPTAAQSAQPDPHTTRRALTPPPASRTRNVPEPRSSSRRSHTRQRTRRPPAGRSLSAFDRFGSDGRVSR